MRNDCIKKTPKHQLPKPRLCLMIELFFKGHVFWCLETKTGAYMYIITFTQLGHMFKGWGGLLKMQQEGMMNLRYRAFISCITWSLNELILFCFLCFYHILPCHMMLLHCSHLWIFSMILHWSSLDVAFRSPEMIDCIYCITFVDAVILCFMSHMFLFCYVEHVCHQMV